MFGFLAVSQIGNSLLIYLKINLELGLRVGKERLVKSGV